MQLFILEARLDHDPFGEGEWDCTVIGIYSTKELAVEQISKQLDWFPEKVFPWWFVIYTEILDAPADIGDPNHELYYYDWNGDYTQKQPSIYYYEKLNQNGEFNYESGQGNN